MSTDAKTNNPMGLYVAYDKLPDRSQEDFLKSLTNNDTVKIVHSNFWDDSSKAQIVLKKVKFLKNWIDSIEKLEENISDLEILLEFNRNDECSDEELANQVYHIIEIHKDEY